MNARAERSEQHFDVTPEYEVRCGGYSLCTKCANVRTKPVKLIPFPTVSTSLFSIVNFYHVQSVEHLQVGKGARDDFWGNIPLRHLGKQSQGAEPDSRNARKG